MSDMNIVDALFLQQSSYIILLSGLLPELEEVVSDVAKDLNFTYLCFNHVKQDYNAVNKRVNDLLEKKKVQGLILCGKQFPRDKLDFKVNLHIHLSINKTLMSELKIEQNHDTYVEELKTNFINKYINIKPGYVVEKIGDDVFDYIIASVGKIVHPEGAVAFRQSKMGGRA
jgi:hypothetical protein